MVCGALFNSGVLPWPNFNPTVASLSLGSLFCAVALLRYRLLALTPLARDTVIEQFADGVIISDADGLLIDINPAATAIFPELGREQCGRPLTEVLSARPQLLQACATLRATAGSSEPLGFDVGIVTVEPRDALTPASEAETRSYSPRLTLIRGRRGRPLAEAIVLYDVTARTHLERELQRIAATDGLTGLLNRRELSRRGDQALAGCRQRGEPLAVLLVDLDDFKPVNDEFGHAAGDAVLRAVAKSCADHVRACDLLARYGGDEICAALPGLASRDALIVAERFRAAVSGLSVWHGDVLIRTTVSVGVAVGGGGDGRTLEELIGDADANLYRAKRHGRDRIIASPLNNGEEASVRSARD
jgi:diguanylate cyclase (GGDEF)-like protein